MAPASADTNGTRSPPTSPVQRVKRALSGTYFAPDYAPSAADYSSISGASYIPDQLDPLGLAVTEAVRHGPFFLALRDLWTCVRMFTLFPGVITPFWTSNPSDEFYLGGRNLFGLALLSFASVFEVVLVLLCIPMFIFLPGSVAALLFAMGQAMVHLICFPLQGPSKIWSAAPTKPETVVKHKRLSGERWFFLNGCCVSGHNVQQNVNVLSETFGRPIFAIHNRTYGVLGDLFECILQRSFDLFTEETRVCYEYIKSYCSDPKVTKVVMIAHSQGCIMASQILDQLYVDMPAEAVAKLEVYTFGNAASHFNNPLRHISKTSESLDSRDLSSTAKGSTNIVSAPDTTTTRKPTPIISTMLPERVVPYIEHYCNSGDMVTRWGALFSAKSILENRFCGHIFINEGASGHMLNQHYLSDMFPRHHRLAGAGHARGTSSDAQHAGVAFLDRVVKLDTATVTQRDKTAGHHLAVMREESKYDVDGDHAAMSADDDHAHVAHKTEVREMTTRTKAQAQENSFRLKWGEGGSLTSHDLSGAEGSRISVVTVGDRRANERYKGKTVRQLSRLWRYLDGGNPDA